MLPIMWLRSSDSWNVSACEDMSFSVLSTKGSIYSLPKVLPRMQILYRPGKFLTYVWPLLTGNDLQWGKNNYNHNEQWWYYDQKCTCNRGKIECTTPRGPENPFVGKSCPQPGGEKKPHGAEWQDPRDKCKLCDCDNGKTVCSKRCPSKQCKNGQILGRSKFDIWPHLTSCGSSLSEVVPGFAICWSWWENFSIR